MQQIITFFILVCLSIGAQASKAEYLKDSIEIEFLGKKYALYNTTKEPSFNKNVSTDHILSFCEQKNNPQMEYISHQLDIIKTSEHLDDWMFYQLVRKAAQEITPKEDDYIGYTINKWYLLSKTGYNVLLSCSENKVLLYVESSDSIFNLPIKYLKGNQYVCMNYHDYGYSIDFETEKFNVVNNIKTEGHLFSFKINSLPNFDENAFSTKDITYHFRQKDCHLNIKINREMESYFRNYPVTDYKNQFNIPINKTTYNSLISALMDKTKNMSTRKGVEYLMAFTRHAFMFEKDTDYFGREKRLSPEQTLLYERSDCEDRSALFYYLVKEIYKLPMIILSYPEHVTVAVKLDKPVRHQVLFNGESFTLCEPTPQSRDLKLGELAPGLKNKPYEIAFAFQPAQK